MPEKGETNWRHGYYDQMPMLTSRWGDHSAQIGSMQDVDLRMFEHDQIVGGHGNSAGYLLSPGAGYQQDDADWPPDVDMGTLSTAVFPAEVTVVYPGAPLGDNSHLRPPQLSGHESKPVGSSRADLASPKQDQKSARLNPSHRPTISRSVTAPEAHHNATPLDPEPPALKRGGTSEDCDDDYMPGEETKNRGRKRQRIPHTAVERRYRENLNAHLDKLRQTVPSLASRCGKGVEGMHDGGVKPSKCEILNGAIEHIGAIDKENQALRNEVKLLRARLEEAEKWYRTNPRGSAFGA